MSQAVTLTALRERIRQIEQPIRHGVLPFGVAAIDDLLPGGGLARGAVHEIVGAGGDEEDGAASAGFIAGILARLSPSYPLSRSAGESLPRTRSGGGSGRCPETGEGLRNTFRASDPHPQLDPHPPAAVAAGPPSPALRERVKRERVKTGTILWCLKQPDLYGPGLIAHGLDPRRLVLVTARRDAELLWVIEEALNTGAAAGIAAVVGEIGRLPMVAGRRLQLAAERSGITALLLRRWRTAAEATAERERPSAALTRWRITALSSRDDRARAHRENAREVMADRSGKNVGQPRWRVELLRCRGGRPGSWEVEVADAAGFVSFSAGLADRPVAPSQSKIARSKPIGQKIGALRFAS